MNDFHDFCARHNLHRSSQSRVLGGVVGGLSETYGWDPTAARIVVVLLALLTHIPLLIIYLAAVFLLPKQ